MDPNLQNTRASCCADLGLGRFQVRLWKDRQTDFAVDEETEIISHIDPKRSTFSHIDEKVFFFWACQKGVGEMHPKIPVITEIYLIHFYYAKYLGFWHIVVAIVCLNSGYYDHEKFNSTLHQS